MTEIAPRAGRAPDPPAPYRRRNHFVVYLFLLSLAGAVSDVGGTARPAWLSAVALAAFVACFVALVELAPHWRSFGSQRPPSPLARAPAPAAGRRDRRAGRCDHAGLGKQLAGAVHLRRGDRGRDGAAALRHGVHLRSRPRRRRLRSQGAHRRRECGDGRRLDAVHDHGRVHLAAAAPSQRPDRRAARLTGRGGAPGGGRRGRRGAPALRPRPARPAGPQPVGDRAQGRARPSPPRARRARRGS